MSSVGSEPATPAARPEFKVTQEHIQRLDILRAAAILLVLLFHFNVAISTVVNKESLGFWRPIFNLGASGVPLFFIISGFCIHLSYLRSPGQTTRTFYWRRFTRIYPAYFVSLVVFTFFGVFKLVGSMNFKQFLLHFLLIHNFFPAAVFYGINSAYWSLAVEMQFYLLFPLLLILRKKSGLIACLIATFALSCLYETLCTIYPQMRLPVSNPTIVPDWYGWIIGACIAESYFARKSFFPESIWLLISLFFLMICFHLWSGSLFVAKFAQYLFFGVLLERYLALSTPLRAWERLLAPIGIVSYSLYLWHYPLIMIFTKGLKFVFPADLQASYLFQFGVCFPLTMLFLTPLVVASYYLFECRAMEWLRGKSRKPKAN